MDDGLAHYLKVRRTIPAAQLVEPGPDPQILREMLTAAVRVPDHGKLAPWRFILLDRPSREKIIAGLIRIAGKSHDEAERRQRTEKARGFADAPLVVAVVSAADPQHPKIPLWEQQLSAGAVCLNLLHAANAYGFGAQWLTGWYAYDPEATRLIGVKEGERIAGFLHIGTPAVPPTERDRPDLDAIVSTWQPAAEN